jgi:hypothetical protein
MHTTEIPFHEIRRAHAYDSSVYLTPALVKMLGPRYLHPQRYSLDKLYDNMSLGKTAVYTDYPMKLSMRYNEKKQDALIRNLTEGLPAEEKINIHAGPSRAVRKVTIREVIEKWQRQRSRFGVTDLHFRDTRFYKTVDAQAISYFNLLTRCPYEVSFLEMMTLVISARGIFTDSHSDDGDGSNHCFIGKKLWLAWDGTEGKQNGLQDCTHDKVPVKARFSMKTFASLKSAHWFIVSDNRTLFMPGNFTHKVVTLDPYIGFGSFYVTFPGYMNTLKRWLLHPTRDVKDNFIEIMNAYTVRKIKRLAKDSPAIQKKLGLPWLKRSVSNWQVGLTKKEKEILSGKRDFTDFLACAESI